MLVLAGVSSVMVQRSSALDLREDFSEDPTTRGWKAYGESQLFRWDSTNYNLQVTWDSSRVNSYFARPLGVTLTRYDDFRVSFNLQLTDVSIGGYGFEIAVGLLNLADATGRTFVRGTGVDSPNLVEFDYFPDPLGTLPWGPSITVMAADYVGKDMTTNWSRGGFAGLALDVNDVYHVEMVHSGADQRIHTDITRNGQPFGPVPDSYLGGDFLDFHVDCLAISSYSDAGGFGGSVLAQGKIDNLAVEASTLAAAWVLSGLNTHNALQVQFYAHTNWSYTLERTTDFQTWAPVSATVIGNESDLSLQDTNAFSTKAFYRLQARQP